jgi:FixJ family two-component response regulator
MLSVISVIDDDVSVRAAIDNFLSSRGYVVHTFASAEEFLQSNHLHSSSCHCGCADVGYERVGPTHTHMRVQGYKVPFIFITAFPEESVRARALKVGAIGFLAKPFAAPDLIKCVETGLTESRGGADS